jgi:hypothetical protein
LCVEAAKLIVRPASEGEQIGGVESQKKALAFSHTLMHFSWGNGNARQRLA